MPQIRRHALRAGIGKTADALREDRSD